MPDIKITLDDIAEMKEYRYFVRGESLKGDIEKPERYRFGWVGSSDFLFDGEENELVRSMMPMRVAPDRYQVGPFGDFNPKFAKMGSDISGLKYCLTGCPPSHPELRAA
ncbi:hypothetical protein M422DRAFT_267031 [Sphaerobolus stellatus SS14]|uniref:Uncharacterized protein n=1 Tax=Sphaerobolus stellatus (strain SS14) TaxID=990650 RepID=A0A0C9TMZ9_SPHS4|nr:hypothetical protein M422DRAFT_267031 [Sphaerobolus stellatus SS14]